MLHQPIDASSSDPRIVTASDHLRTMCEVCDSPTVPIGDIKGQWRGRMFRLRHCPTCHFSFVEDPDTDFSNIYDADYYAGKGADPLIDYEFEWFNLATTIRRYEWSGVSQVVRTISGLDDDTVWLDFGCGNGGLVAWAREHLGVRAYGYDTGYIVETARSRGISMLDDEDLSSLDGRCDVVTAIEVLEHLSDPLKTLARIHQLLKPDGLFFFTTGNAEPHRHSFTNWSYVRPEIHLSYYEPGTIELALRKAGFDVEYHGFVSGFTHIITYKVLKNLRIKKQTSLLKLVPWQPLAHIVDNRYGVSRFPVGRKRN